MAQRWSGDDFAGGDADMLALNANILEFPYAEAPPGETPRMPAISRSISKTWEAWERSKAVPRAPYLPAHYSPAASAPWA